MAQTKYYHKGRTPDAAAYWHKAVEPWVPATAVPYLSHMMGHMNVELEISPPRSSKLGHYRVAYKNRPQSISINCDLSPERFLLTLVHELAHLVSFEEFGRKIKPHGTEWKRTFQTLMAPLLCEEVFSPKILPQLIDHLNSPKATSCVDMDLHRAFEELDGKQYLTLDDIPHGARFSLNTGRTFIKGQKKRTRYLCKEVPRMTAYLIHGITEVALEEPETLLSAT